MMKEICEQPAVIGDTLQALRQSAAAPDRAAGAAVRFRDRAARSPSSPAAPPSLAGMVGKYWFEQLARLPVEFDIASRVPLSRGADADGRRHHRDLAVRRDRRYPGGPALCQEPGAEDPLRSSTSPESTIARESDVVLHTLAGPEIGVASTKAFTTQLTVLACLAIAAARARGAIGDDREAELSAALTEVPARAAEVLNHDATPARDRPRGGEGARRAVPRPRHLLSRSRSKARSS